MKAPEKIYLQVCGDCKDNDCENCKFEDLEDNVTWCKDEIFDKDIEYTRTDTFIEKACEWLKNSSYGYLTENWGGIELDRETLAVDFANYMKGE